MKKKGIPVQLPWPLRNLKNHYHRLTRKKKTDMIYIRPKIVAKTQDVPLDGTIFFGNRGVHAHSCIMGTQGKMAGNQKICIRTKDQLFLPEFIYLMLSL